MCLFSMCIVKRFFNLQESVNLDVGGKKSLFSVTSN